MTNKIRKMDSHHSKSISKLSLRENDIVSPKIKKMNGASLIEKEKLRYLLANISVITVIFKMVMQLSVMKNKEMYILTKQAKF